MSGPGPWPLPRPEERDDEETFVQSPRPLEAVPEDGAPEHRPYVKYSTGDETARDEETARDDEATQLTEDDGGATGVDDGHDEATRIADADDGRADGDGRPPLTLLQGGAAGSAAPSAADLPVRRSTYAPAQEQPELPAAAAGAGRRLAAWLLAHVVDVATLGGLLAVVGVVHAWGMGRYPAFFDDEGTYVSQAWALLKLHALAPYTYWYDHPPFGWIQLAAWDWLVPSFGPGQYAIADARGFILVLLLASSVFVYVIARRLRLSPPFAALAVLLFTLSPLALWFQRMVLLDNIGMAWLLLALMLALTPRGRLFAYGAAGVALAGAVLSKETFLLFAPAVLLAVWQTAPKSSRRFALAMFITLFVLIGSFYPLFSLLRGELLPGAGHTSLIHGIAYQLTRPGSGSIFSAGSQAHTVLTGWLQTDPWVLGLGLVLLPISLAVRRLRPIGVALLVGLAMLLRPNGYLPGMYVVGLLPFGALVIAAAVDLGWKSLRTFLEERRAGSGEPAHDGDHRPAGVKTYRSGAARRSRALRVVAMAAAVAAVAALAIGPARSWAAGDRPALTSDPAAPSRMAVDWLSRHASHRAHLLVDDSVWMDLVDRGFQPSRTIWYSKLDQDPSLGGTRWNKFNYAVRSSLVKLSEWGPNARAVWSHGKTVATFRAGGQWVQIRKIGKVTQLPSQPGTGP